MTENPISQTEPVNIVINDTKDIKRSRKSILAFVSLTLGIITMILALKTLSSQFQVRNLQLKTK